LRSVIEICLAGDFGLTNATTVFLANDLRQNNRQSASQTVLISATVIASSSVAIGLIVACAIPVLHTLFPNTSQSLLNEASTAWLAISFAVPVLIFQRFFDAILEAKAKFHTLSILITFSAILEGTALILTATYTRNIAAMATALLFCNIILLSIRFIFTYATVSPNLEYPCSWSKDRFRAMLSHASQSFLVFVGSLIFASGDKIVVSMILGSPSTGTYAIIVSLCRQINTISAALIRPSMQAIALTVTHDPTTHKSARQTILRSSIVLCTVSSFGMAWVLLLLTPFMPRWVPETKPILNIIRATILFYAIYSTGAAGHFYFFGIRKPNIVAALSLPAGLAAICAIASLAAMYGITGALYGCIAYCFTICLNALATRDAGLNSFTWTRILSLSIGVYCCTWWALDMFSPTAFNDSFTSFFHEHPNLRT